MKKIQNILPSHIVLFAFFLSFIGACIMGLPILRDPDMSWHIAAGDAIRELGALPERDIWSFTKQEQTWYNLSWAWDIVLSFIHQKTGIEGIFIFAKICPALVVASLVYCLAKRQNIGVMQIIFTAITSFFCMMEFAYGRPQIFGLLLLIIFHHLLHKTRENNQAKNLFILPFLVVLWANIHGSFFLAALPLGAFGLEAIYTKNWKWLKYLLIISFLCVFATLINPYGIYVYVGIMRTMHSVISSYIVEWQRFTFADTMGATLWVCLFVLLSNLRTSSAHFSDKILAVACLFGTFIAIRNVGVLAVLGAPYLAMNMPAEDASDKAIKKLSAFMFSYSRSLFFAFVSFLAIVATYFVSPLMGKGFYYEDVKKSSASAIDYVVKNYTGKNVLNDYGIGGRIIYETGGKLPVFVDGRAGTAYSEELLSDYIEFIDLKDGWQKKTIDKYNIDVLLLENSSYFVKLYEKGVYSSEWKIVYHDDYASVYEKKKID